MKGDLRTHTIVHTITSIFDEEVNAFIEDVALESIIFKSAPAQFSASGLVFIAHITYREI